MKLVLFLNMGGATNLQDCEVFLKNMFNDPYILGIKNRFLRKFVAWIITKARVKAMQENYKKMGGKSPLNELTQSLCNKLNLKQDEFKFDFVNLYVPPFATEILQKYTLNESDEIILFPLYPHHSCTTVTSSLEVLQNEISKQKIQAKVKT
ncbi:ferrochelatase, partial [Campylobacter jejuni]